MTKKTHVAVGVAATLPLFSVYNPIVFLGLLGSIAPDWDILLRLLGIKHRTITHSLIALFLTTIVIVPVNIKVALMWGLNYSIHLILDSFTKMGVPFLYPWNKKYYGFKLIKTGGSEDLFICLLTIFFICTQYII